MKRAQIPFAIAAAVLFVAGTASAQTIAWTEAGTSTPWYTSANWDPVTASGDWTTSNIAQFNNAGSATTATIDIATASLSIGAIEDTAARTRALTISNSSGTAGTLTLNGVEVNGISNTILRNASDSLLTLTNGSGTMNVVLGNTTDNVVQIDGAGGFTIGSAITGSGRNLTLRGGGAGVLRLQGANTYSGATTISQGSLWINTQATANSSGYTLNDANTGSSNTTLRFEGNFNPSRTGVGGVGLHDASPITVANLGNGTTTIDISSSSATNWINTTAVLNKAVTLQSNGDGIRAGFVTFSGPGAGAGNDTIIYDGIGGNKNWNTYENVGTYVPQPNTYEGNVRFTGGMTTLQNKSYANPAYTNMMIPDTASVTIDAGSTFRLAWGSEAFDGLNGAGAMQNGTAGAVITIGASNGSGSFSGVISNGGTATNIEKTGSGTQTLTGGNTYTGTTVINGGTVTLGVGGTLSNTSAITIGSGATLNLSGSANNQLATGASSTLAINGTLNATTNQAHTLAFLSTYFSSITMNNGTLANTFGPNTTNFGAFYVAANRTITATGANTISGVGVIGISTGVVLTLSPTTADDSINVTGTIGQGSSGTAGGLAKSGLGVVTLTGASTYAGGTTVNAGTLLANNASGSATGTGAVVINGGTLGGSGSISGAVTVNDGGRLAPGNSIDSLATGSNIWNAGGSLAFEFSTDGGTGSAGAQWDLLTITGNLNLSGADAESFTIDLITMANGTTPGSLADWDANTDHTWAGFVTTTTGFVDFDPAKFTFNVDAFQNDLNGSFSVVQNGNSLDLVYAAVPEPGTVGLILVGGGMLWMFRRKRLTCER